MLTHDFIPARSGGSRFLMLVMHGLGDSMESYRPLVGELAIPRMNYLLLNAPDHYMGGYSWYDIYDNPEPGIVRSRQLIAELLEHQHRQGFPYEKMFVFGFSQGCLMTTEIGMRFPNVLGGLIGISGYVYDPEKLFAERSAVAEKQSFLITHGDMDPLLPLDHSRRIYRFLAESGIPIQWVEFNKAHSFAGEPEFAVIRDFVNQRMDQIDSNG
jgi:phospholipase/carboxylesterase